MESRRGGMDRCLLAPYGVPRQRDGMRGGQSASWGMGRVSCLVNLLTYWTIREGLKTLADRQKAPKGLGGLNTSGIMGRALCVTSRILQSLTALLWGCHFQDTKNNLVPFILERRFHSSFLLRVFVPSW